jgi:hypothetical protein
MVKLTRLATFPTTTEVEHDRWSVGIVGGDRRLEKMKIKWTIIGTFVLNFTVRLLSRTFRGL